MQKVTKPISIALSLIASLAIISTPTTAIYTEDESPDNPLIRATDDDYADIVPLTTEYDPFDDSIAEPSDLARNPDPDPDEKDTSWIWITVTATAVTAAAITIILSSTKPKPKSSPKQK